LAVLSQAPARQVVHAGAIVNRNGLTMVRSQVVSSYDALIRQAHVDRACYVQSLLDRGITALQRLLEGALHALRDVLYVSSDASYLAHARNHADLKRRYLLLEREHARVAADVGR
jgi:hypothetical protein